MCSVPELKHHAHSCPEKVSIMLCLVSFACHVSHSFFCQILTCKKELKYLVSAVRVVRSEKHLAQCLGEERSVWFPLYAFCIHLSGRSRNWGPGRTPSLIKHSEIASETISGPQIPLVSEECAEVSLLEITHVMVQAGSIVLHVENDTTLKPTNRSS